MEIVLILAGAALILFLILIQSIESNRLIKAQLFLQLNEKISKDSDFRKIERLLDDSESFDFTHLVGSEKENFEEYLRFFDSLVRIQVPNRFNTSEAELLFGRAARLLNRHYQVRNYISENYKNLEEVLEMNSLEKKKLSGK